MAEKDAEIIRIAKERFKDGLSADSENREDFRSDINFLNGIGVWDEGVKKQRELNGQPCLIIDRLNGHVRQVTNDMRQNPIGCKVSPASAGADIETAFALEGLIRHIQYISNAESVYENGFYYAVAGGFGYWRVVYDYLPGTFNKEIYIKPIHNSLSVVKDRMARSLDGGDWRYCFITEDVDKTEFQRKYPDADTSGWKLDSDGWVTEKTVRVCEYFDLVEEKETLYLMRDGSVLTKEKYEASGTKERPVDEREGAVKKVKWYLLGGDTILDRRDWPGSMIPVIPCYGEQIELDGRQKLISLIRRAKDPAKMLSYFRSTETHLLALTPIAPVVVAEGQIEGYEDDWDNANNSSSPYLTYKPTSIDGQLVPMPQRQPFAPPPTGVLQGAANAEIDIMRSTGISEAGLGFKSNETSGRAILARQREGDTSTYHFIDNCARSVRRTAEIIVDLIPGVFDVPQVMRILGEDGTPAQIGIAGKDEEADITKGIFQFGVGTYDVVVSSGASYNTRRQESADMLMELASRDPSLMQVAGDLIIETLDIPGGEKLIGRLKAANPLAQQQDAPQIPPEIQQQVEQMNMQMEQMAQALQEKDMQIQQLSTEQQIEQTKLMLDQQKLEIDRFRAETDRQRVETEMAIHASKSSDVTESEKLNHNTELQIRLKEMEHEHQENLKMFETRMEMMKNKSPEECEMMDSVMNGDPSPSTIAMMQLQADIKAQTEVLSALTLQLNKPKEAVALRDDCGNLIGIKTI